MVGGVGQSILLDTWILGGKDNAKVGEEGKGGNGIRGIRAG